jgi:hypothetical protein
LIHGRAKAIKVAFRSLDLSDQFRFGLAEGTDSVSFANSPDFFHLHLGPPFDHPLNDPPTALTRVRLQNKPVLPKSSSPAVLSIQVSMNGSLLSTTEIISPQDVDTTPVPFL